MKTFSIPALLIAAMAAGASFAQAQNPTTTITPAAPAQVVPRMPTTAVPTVPPAALPTVPPKAPPVSTVAVTVNDASISSKVREGIASDPDLKSMSVTVETMDAVVTLNGTADSSEQIARAMALARAVDGVKSVTNILAVKSS